MGSVSPTPAPAGPVRRTSQRRVARSDSRSALNHAENQPVAPAGEQVSRLDLHQLQRLRHEEKLHAQYKNNNDESSDEEMPIPMKLSALTKSILDFDGNVRQTSEAPAPRPSPRRTRRQAQALGSSTSSAAESRRHLRSGSVQPTDPQNDKAQNSDADSASRDKEPTPPPKKRVVRLSHTPQSLNEMNHAKRRSASTQLSTQRNQPLGRSVSGDKPGDDRFEYPVDINTPGQNPRVVRIVTGSSGKSSSKRGRLGSAAPSSGRSHQERSIMDKSAAEADDGSYEDPDAVARNAPPVSVGNFGNSQGSMRVKRTGKFAGSFLSGPARRAKRTASEEQDDDMDAMMNGEDQGLDDVPSVSRSYAEDGRDFHSGSPLGGSGGVRSSQRHRTSDAEPRDSARRGSPQLSSSRRDMEPEQDAVYRDEPPVVAVPSRRPELPSNHDQENEMPVSMKRTSRPLIDHISPKIPEKFRQADVKSHRDASPDRKPLSVVERNTPHRAAPPPPPKMSVLDTATANAGAAAASQSKQRRNVLRVNGKCYTRLDCLGRGGSAKVYRVTAENGKMFALKRVLLGRADAVTMKGCLGEIDLLTKLSGVDRVIKLFDYEMNDEKHVLTLLMEMGELDLNTLLRTRQSPECARFDPVFVRFYWKEMLEALQSVHQYDIVHSDLKPANFVLVQGRLKLIDFGIANAIKTDETVNVHRDTNIGTPNYMSPESLVDSNNPRGVRGATGPKLMKMGKPSDVWSLGCILYQMVYGVPPFGHISDQILRCQTIIDWSYPIEFPSRGMGGVPIPHSLLRTMRRCLERDQSLRPTCEELLRPSDPFLYPGEVGDKAIPIDEELLGKVIQSVVSRCRERVPAEAESSTVWTQAYWASIRKAAAGRT